MRTLFLVCLFSIVLLRIGKDLNINELMKFLSVISLTIIGLAILMLMFVKIPQK